MKDTYEYFLERWNLLCEWSAPLPGYERAVLVLREQIAEYVASVHRDIAKRRAEDARMANAAHMATKKAQAWDAFVDDFRAHGPAMGWGTLQDLRRSLGDFRMDNPDEVTQ